jgi:MFS family permease
VSSTTTRRPVARASDSPWSPLRHGVFRAIWIASVASNLGTWMQNVGAVWLMTSLTPSATMVALIQTATSLPVFLVGLPAGALADVVDRRRLLIWTQAWMLLAATLLGVLTLMNLTTAWILLALTFALGLGSALNGPAWQAIITELVPERELSTAVTLNGVSFNVARAVGPAIGGLLVAVAGPGAVFLLNAVSFLAVVVALYRWRRVPVASALPTESVLGAVRAGLRYVRFARHVQIVLLRVGVFAFCASALWALMPVVAAERLGEGAAGYGLLLGAIGVGAVLGALVLPRMRSRLPIDAIITFGGVLFALSTAALGLVGQLAPLGLALAVGGVAWTALMSSFTVSVQAGSAPWVQARTVAAYLLIFQGALALGSAGWGVLAEQVGTRWALLAAALLMLLVLAATARWKLAPGLERDLRPSTHWPDPRVVNEPEPNEGPVLVVVEYRVAVEQVAEFVQAMHEMAVLRRRDGATSWGLFRDPSDPARYLETFSIDTWAEHMRQHERVTMSDLEIETRAYSFLRGIERPRTSHFVAVDVF